MLSAFVINLKKNKVRLVSSFLGFCLFFIEKFGLGFFLMLLGIAPSEGS
jgi:hypothetical protein